jgi:SMODS and SLOG-associating 2TM effector domain 1
MNANPQLDLVEEQIREQVDFYTDKKTFNRRMAIRITALSAILTALTTVAVGAAKMFSPGWIGATGLPLLALVTSGGASVVTAWAALFSNRKLWVLNNTTIAALYELQSDIDFRKRDESAEVSAAEAAEFFGRLKKIINDAESALRATYSG